MKATPLDLTKFLRTPLRACARLAFVFALSLVCYVAHALETSPHWENVDGSDRYGYWVLGFSGGYWDETTGYWDYSAGYGHDEYRNVNGRYEYDEYGVLRFYEDSITVWVPDPVWVSVPEYVDQSTPDTWVDLVPPQDPPKILEQHSIDLELNVLPTNLILSALQGRKGWAVLRWTVDENGVVEVTERQADVGSTWGIPGGGYSVIEGTPGSSYDNIRLYGHVWSNLNALNLFTDSAADWDMTISMYTSPSSVSGFVSGSHDLFPTFALSVDGMQVYYHQQVDEGFMYTGGMGAGTSVWAPFGF